MVATMDSNIPNIKLSLYTAVASEANWKCGGGALKAQAPPLPGSDALGCTETRPLKMI